MNSVFRKIGIGAGIFFITVVGIGLILPRHFSLERQIIISLSVEKLFDLLLDLEEFQNWSPWNESDPDSQISFGEIKKGLNASFSWKGKKSGSGKMKIIEVDFPNKIKTQLEFEEGGRAFSSWIFAPSAEGTSLTWDFQMDNEFDIFSRYFSYFFLENMLSKDYEKGLSNLKKYLECRK